MAKTLTLLIAVALGIGGSDARAQKADPSGTWTWTLPARPNSTQLRKITLVVKVKGDKVTGTLSHLGPRGDTVSEDIQDGKIKGSTLSFHVSREQHGDTIVTNYKMKIAADALTGTSEFVRNGDQQSVPVLFKRTAGSPP